MNVRPVNPIIKEMYNDLHTEPSSPTTFVHLHHHDDFSALNDLEIERLFQHLLLQNIYGHYLNCLRTIENDDKCVGGLVQLCKKLFNKTLST